MLINDQFKPYYRMLLLCFCLDLLMKRSMVFSKNYQILSASKPMFILLINSDELLMAE